jgi:predicted CoA-substrate-specific enzyme activase
LGKPISEITCQAKGVNWLFPDSEVIIDIGGQDFKVIKLGKEGRVLNFAMNDKCAAGTGRYLELMAGLFSVELDEFSKMTDFKNGGASITSVCTVFAETEVVNHISKGTEEAEIVAGIFVAVARRVYSLAKRHIQDSDSIVFTGGVAKNVGMKTALERVTNCAVLLPQEPQITAALGAALFAEGNAKKPIG